MRTYYNDNDSFVCDWLRNLIEAKLLPEGEVDERPIQEVKPDDLKGFDRHHFFAGIGGWELALRYAGWAIDRPVWTGSCPCQPLSTAGNQRGHLDERHVWGDFCRLIAESNPTTVFGEQVGGPLGREWLSAVRLDLESLGYAIGIADLPATSVGAPHTRQRLYWVAHLAHTDGRTRRKAKSRRREASPRETPQRQARHADGTSKDMAESSGITGRCDTTRKLSGCGGSTPTDQIGESGGLGQDVGDTDQQRLPRFVEETRSGNDEKNRGAGSERSGEHASHDTSAQWRELEWIECIDGLRPFKPPILPVAYGVPNRVGMLRAAGNAIVPQVAQAFIEAFMECRPD